MNEKLKKSNFKTQEGQQWLEAWHQKVLKTQQLDYQTIKVDTSYGETHVWAKNHEEKNKPALLFLPGFRTSSIYWDLNKTLAPFYKDYRIYLVDVIGQPSLSAGTTPAVKGDGYGFWLKEVLDKLGLDKVVVSGASFGGQLMIKLAKVAPERIICLVGFNPVGIQYVNLGLRASWYNLLHLLFPTNKNIDLYLNKMVLNPALKIEESCRQLLLEYQYYVIQNFKSGSDYPYRFSDEELKTLKVPVYLILCEDDALIQQQKTGARAQKTIPNLKEVFFVSKIGHGIELAKEAYVLFQRVLEQENVG